MGAKGIEVLTPRERDVLRALGMGRSSKQVARELGLTIDTVRSYTKHIYAVLDVHNRAEAAVVAIEAGLVGTPGHTVGEPVDPRYAIAAPIRAIIGREQELAKLVRLVAERRLVSIVGIGGAGKTLLALETARAHVAATGHRAAFVSLENIDDGVGLAISIAEAMGVHLQRTTDDVWDEVARLAGHGPCLLVLDNLEHLVTHAERLVGLLQALPALRLLITSRQPLGVAEEAVLRIDGLAFPDHDSTPPEPYGAVELFTHEVARLDAQRTLLPNDLQAVSEICRRVGGLPLALILAAGWVDVLSLEDIAAELGKSTRLLVSESAVLERHRSLDALVDQSIERRPLPEQRVLARLSVFDGGFDRLAARVVAGATVQQLASLVRSSLVRHDPAAGRYDLHPLVRERALALLEEQHQATPTWAAHRDHYATYVSRWADAMAGQQIPPPQRDAVAAFEREHDNIRAAWLDAAAKGDAAHALAMLDPLVMWLDHASDLLECDALLSFALDAPLAETLWPRLVLHREYIRFQSGSLDPSDCRVHEALEAVQAEDSAWEAPAEVMTAFLEVAVLGQPEEAFARVLRLASPDASTPPYWRHRAQMLLGFMYAAMGKPEAAVTAHRAAMDDAIADGDHSAAQVETLFIALGLIRLNRHEEVTDVLATAEHLLTLLPNPKIDATALLVELILAVFDGEDIDLLASRQQNALLMQIVRENQHLANLQHGVMALARGARGDGDAAQEGRDMQDEDVAVGFFGESVLWAELGIALAAAANKELDDARRHAEAGRAWQQGAGLVTSEVDTVLTIIDAVAAVQDHDRVRATILIDEALSTPSLLTALLRKSAAVERCRTLR